MLCAVNDSAQVGIGFSAYNKKSNIHGIGNGFAYVR
jgi:hypothetical protein